MTKETLLKVLNKKIDAVKKDVNCWYNIYQVSSAKFNLLEGFVDELSKLEEAEEKKGD